MYTVQAMPCWIKIGVFFLNSVVMKHQFVAYDYQHVETAEVVRDLTFLTCDKGVRTSLTPVDLPLATGDLKNDGRAWKCMVKRLCFTKNAKIQMTYHDHVTYKMIKLNILYKSYAKCYLGSQVKNKVNLGRPVASLTISGGQEVHFSNFSSNPDQFFLFFLKFPYHRLKLEEI